MTENELKRIAPIGSVWAEKSPLPDSPSTLFRVTGHRWYNTDQNWGVTYGDGRGWIAGKVLVLTHDQLQPVMDD